MAELARLLPAHVDAADVFDREVIDRTGSGGSIFTGLNGLRLRPRPCVNLDHRNIDRSPPRSSRMPQDFLRRYRNSSVSGLILSWLPNPCWSSTRSNRLPRTDLEHLHDRVSHTRLQRVVQQIPGCQAVVAFGLQQIEHQTAERLVGANDD